MPQLRTTDARLQSARRLASEQLLHLHQYTWSSEDQEEFEDSFSWFMKVEWWSSTADMADHLVQYVLTFKTSDEPVNG